MPGLERLATGRVGEPSRGGGAAASLFSLLLLLLLLQGAMLTLSLVASVDSEQSIICCVMLHFCRGCLGELGMRRRPNPSGGKPLGTGSSQAARNAINSLIRLQPRPAFISLPLAACSSQLVF